MKKIKISVISFVIMLFVSTVGVSAYDFSVNVKGTNYNASYPNTYVLTCCVGDATKAYTTATNRKSREYNINAYIGEYVNGKGFVNRNSNVAKVKPGYQVVSGNISRLKFSKLRYYDHSSYVYSLISDKSIIESFSLKAEQRYD